MCSLVARFARAARVPVSNRDLATKGFFRASCCLGMGIPSGRVMKREHSCNAVAVVECNCQ